MTQISGGTSANPLSTPTPATQQPDAQPPTTPVASNVDALALCNDLEALLNRAGLEMTAAGEVVVKDSTEVGETEGATGLAAHEQIYAGTEARLLPPSPPRIEMTPERREGAESFAANLDLVFNDMFLLPNHGAATPGATARANDAPVAGPLAGISEEDLRKIATLTADQLLAAFLKLNITDPNNSVETHNKLQEFATNMRQEAIKNSIKQLEVAAKKLAEASAYADKAGAWGKIITVVVIIVAIVAAVFTCGASLAAGGAVLGMVSAATAKAIVLACAIVIALLQTVNAAMQKEAANKSADAAESQTGAKVAEKLAEMFQKQIQEQSEIIKMIMEAKNQVVDAVLKMLNAMFASSNKLLSAQMAR